MALRSALLALPLLAATAAAQVPAPAPAAVEAPVAPAFEPHRPGPDRIGLGVALGASGILPVVYVPIDVRGTRTELELGYEGTRGEEEGDSLLRLGVGVFGLGPADGSVRGYGGARLSYGRAEAGGETGAALRVAAALGGEWVPHPSVAIGVEAQLGHTWVTEPDGAPNRIDTSAQAFLRVFTSLDRRRARPASAAASAGAAPQATPSSAERSPPPAAAPPRPKRLVRCESSGDCEGVDFCYEGYCRH